MPDSKSFLSFITPRSSVAVRSCCSACRSIHFHRIAIQPPIVACDAPLFACTLIDPAYSYIYLIWPYRSRRSGPIKHRALLVLELEYIAIISISVHTKPITISQMVRKNIKFKFQLDAAKCRYKKQWAFETLFVCYYIYIYWAAQLFLFSPQNLQYTSIRTMKNMIEIKFKSVMPIENRSSHRDFRFFTVIALPFMHSTQSRQFQSKQLISLCNEMISNWIRTAMASLCEGRWMTVYRMGPRLLVVVRETFVTAILIVFT